MCVCLLDIGRCLDLISWFFFFFFIITIILAKAASGASPSSWTVG